MKRILALIIVLAAAALTAQAGQHDNEKKIIKGFAGGMMVHSGYLKGGDNPFGYEPSGATFGIGGLAKVNLTKHFRTGFEGYVSTMGLGKDLAKGSFNKVFWTGLLGDFFWKAGKFYPYVGCTVGGGMETAYYMFSGEKSDWVPESNAVFHKNPFFAVDPFAGVEYAVGQTIRLTLKADYLLAIHSNSINKPLGPRIYFGIIFAH